MSDTGEHRGTTADGQDDVLAVLRRRPDATLAELALETGLTEGTVWMAVSALSQRGWIRRNQEGWKVRR
jgi:DNA-binding MarR family transcriptional regulator